MNEVQVELEERHLALPAKYNVLVASIFTGIMRLWETRIVCNTFKIALCALHSEETPPSLPSGAAGRALTELTTIKYSEFDGYNYVTGTSLLVYATALFDTFLTDTTIFLLTLHPRVIGSTNQISVSEMLDSASKYDALNKAIRQKARALSFETFLNRLKFLNKTFGLGIALDESERIALAEYATLRHAVVHEQSSFVVELDDVGIPTLRKKACPQHPTPVANDQLVRAVRTYMKILRRVYSAIMERVIKAPDNMEYCRLCEALDRMRS